MNGKIQNKTLGHLSSYCTGNLTCRIDLQSTEWKLQENDTAIAYNTRSGMYTITCVANNMTQCGLPGAPCCPNTPSTDYYYPPANPGVVSCQGPVPGLYCWNGICQSNSDDCGRLGKACCGHEANDTCTGIFAYFPWWSCKDSGTYCDATRICRKNSPRCGAVGAPCCYPNSTDTPGKLGRWGNSWYFPLCTDSNAYCDISNSKTSSPVCVKDAADCGKVGSACCYGAAGASNFGCNGGQAPGLARDCAKAVHCNGTRLGNRTVADALLPSYPDFGGVCLAGCGALVC